MGNALIEVCSTTELPMGISKHPTNTKPIIMYASMNAGSGSNDGTIDPALLTLTNSGNGSGGGSGSGIGSGIGSSGAGATNSSASNTVSGDIPNTSFFKSDQERLEFLAKYKTPGSVKEIEIDGYNKEDINKNKQGLDFIYKVLEARSKPLRQLSEKMFDLDTQRFMKRHLETHHPARYEKLKDPGYPYTVSISWQRTMNNKKFRDLFKTD